MAVLKASDVEVARQSFVEVKEALGEEAKSGESGISLTEVTLTPEQAPRKLMAMAVRYSLYVLERVAPGPGVEVRVAPYAAVKILEGPKSDPHNLTPPDVIELDPWVWMRMACGLTTWEQEKAAGHISAVGERDNLSRLLPIEV